MPMRTSEDDLVPPAVVVEGSPMFVYISDVGHDRSPNQTDRETLIAARDAIERELNRLADGGM